MQEEKYRDWLEGRVRGARTRIDQISRVRRLEVAFGDLDTAFDRDGMAQVVTALAYTAWDGRRGKALPAGITTRGDRAEAMATLRHAAGLYRSFRIETTEAPLPAELLPLHRPLRTPTKRKLQPTGYWLFAASPGTWDADSWFEAGERSLLYTVPG
ncbi:hypothetical protein EIK56_27190 [Sphingomonas sp. C8-2]|nr:hypothetical protein EIK56_27190 [Sphingomonas sp. C8-2]